LVISKGAIRNSTLLPPLYQIVDDPAASHSLLGDDPDAKENGLLQDHQPKENAQTDAFSSSHDLFQTGRVLEALDSLNSCDLFYFRMDLFLNNSL
jgi:hypothetical protein